MPQRIFIFLLLTIPIAWHALYAADDDSARQVYALVGQTGAAASFGRGESDGYTLAVEEWNAKRGLDSKKIDLVVEDTQTKQSSLLSAYHRLSLLDPKVILGPTWLDASQSVIPVARRDKVLLVTPSAAVEAFSEENRDWPVSFYHNSSREVAVLVQGLKSLGLKKIAVIYEEEPFSELILRLLQKHLPAESVHFGVQGGETAFQGILTRLRTTICPSWTDTAMAQLANTPLSSEEMIEPRDILNTIRWLLSLSPQVCVKEISLECAADLL